MKKCRYKKVETIKKHYGNDWSNLWLNDVVFINEDLSDVILPNDYKLFQNIRNKSLVRCKLPTMDYSNYNFKRVDIRGCEIGEGSLLSSSSNLFQNILDKSLYDCTLPSMDYSIYNFNDIDIEYCIFGEGSILPADTEFFQRILHKSIGS